MNSPLELELEPISFYEDDAYRAMLSHAPQKSSNTGRPKTTAATPRARRAARPSLESKGPHNSWQCVWLVSWREHHGCWCWCLGCGVEEEAGAEVEGEEEEEEEEEAEEEEEEEAEESRTPSVERVAQSHTDEKHTSKTAPIATPERAEAGNPRRMMRRLILEAKKYVANANKTRNIPASVGPRTRASSTTTPSGATYTAC